MSSLYYPLLVIWVLLQSVSSLKMVSLVEPYLVQSPSSSEGADKERDDEDLPLYRDLPPVMKAAKDLTEALEATRNLMLVRPPFMENDFLSKLKQAAAEYRSVVIGEPPHLFDLQIGKSSIPEKIKLSSKIFHAEPRASPEHQEDSTEKTDKVQVGHAEKKNGTLLGKDPSIDFSTKESSTDDQVQKLADEQGESTDIPIPNTESPLPPPYPEPGANVGVNVEAPYTHVQVKRGSGNGHSTYGADIGVRVEAPFTNVKVRKLADIPAGALPGSNGGGGVAVYPDVGVRVEAPFVRVRVDGPAYHNAPGVVQEGMVPVRKHREDHHSRNDRPLNLDINIPGIFNLKLLKDENGRGRLGIGVLPAFSSFVNPHKASDPYPGPPPSY